MRTPPLSTPAATSAVQRSLLRRRPLVQALAIAMSMHFQAAHAATITVNSAVDDTNLCSLRNAITAANTDSVVGNCDPGSNDDVIDLSGISGQIITLGGTQLPAFTSNVDIEGAGVIIDADNLSRVFSVTSASPLVLSISDLTLQNGSTGFAGGALYVVGASHDISLDLCTLSGNTAGFGGAVYSKHVNLAVTNSTISNNFSSYGAALGGFYTQLTMSNSTLSGNSGQSVGALAVAYSSTADLINTTFSGNSSDPGGSSAIYAANDSVLTLTNSTVTGNSVTSGGAIGLKYGATVNFENSVVADSIGGTSCTSLYSDVTTAGVNLVQNNGNCVFPAPIPLDLDPLLGPLSDNGGPTLTHMPQALSPVLDVGDNNLVTGVSFDQRGAGFRRVNAASSNVDLGAVEVQTFQTGPDFVVTSADDVDDGFCDPMPDHCSLREALDSAGDDGVDSTLVFDDGLLLPQAVTITLAGTQLPTIDSSVSIDGGGITIDANAQSRVFYAAAQSELTLDQITLNNGLANGGGCILVLDGELILTDSTISGCASSRQGGAIAADKAVGVTLINSTVSGNSASQTGGGIYLYDSTASLIQTTISDNQADNNGGAIFVYYSSTLKLQNSILANSSALDDCVLSNATILPMGINLIEDQGNCGIPSGPDLLEMDPLLAPLTDNGGLTKTHAPMNGSPVFNMGDNSLVPAGVDFDQRGAGFPRISNDLVDLGAVELSSGILSIEATMLQVNEGTTSVQVDISRSGGSEGGVSASINTVDGSASAGEDFTGISNASVSFVAGDTQTKSIVIDITDDDVHEPDETFQLTMSDPMGGALIDNGSVEITIVNDDPVPVPGTLTLQPGSLSVSEAGGTAELTVLRSGGVSGAVSISVNTASGTALAGQDFQAIANAVVSFADGEDGTKPVSVTLINDAVVEASETFEVTLSNPTGGAGVGNISSSVTITDDDKNTDPLIFESSFEDQP